MSNVMCKLLSVNCQCVAIVSNDLGQLILTLFIVTWRIQ